MPDWVEALRVRVDAILGRTSDSATLSEFLEGGGVNPHVDSDVFEPHVAAVSLGRGKLTFYSGDPATFRTGGDPGKKTREFDIPSGSLYVMIQRTVHSFTATELRYSIVFRKTAVRAPEPQGMPRRRA